MKQYYGYKSTTKGGTETLGLLPLTEDAPFQFGVYDYEKDELILMSKDSKQELQMFQKMNEVGELEVKNKNGRNFPLVERRLINNNLSFYLSGNDMNWFITNMVENSVLVLNTIENIKSEYSESQRKAVSTVTGPEISSEGQQPLSTEEGSELSGDTEQGRESTDSTEEQE